jgi:YD repeat-containing protein
MKKILFACLFPLFLGSCDEAENSPPGEFATYVTLLDGTSARVDWDTSIDPDGGIVTYTLFLNDELVLSETSNQMHIFTDLEFEQDYAGKVIAIDATGMRTISEFSFNTPYLPTAFDISITSLEFTGAHLSWEQSIVSDGTPVVYDVYLNDNLIESNISETSVVISDLPANTHPATYQVKVTAKSTEEWTTDSFVSFTPLALDGVIKKMVYHYWFGSINGEEIYRDYPFTVQRDELDQITKITLISNIEQEFDYDGNGRLTSTSEVDFNFEDWIYTYNADGSVASYSQVRNGETHILNFTHDGNTMTGLYDIIRANQTVSRQGKRIVRKNMDNSVIVFQYLYKGGSIYTPYIKDSINYDTKGNIKSFYTDRYTESGTVYDSKLVTVTYDNAPNPFYDINPMAYLKEKNGLSLYLFYGFHISTVDQAFSHLSLRQKTPNNPTQINSTVFTNTYRDKYPVKLEYSGKSETIEFEFE